MKGHKFDWRKKRRPPFSIILVQHSHGQWRREVRMDRRWIGITSARRDPLVRWLGKRGTQRFVCRHNGTLWAKPLRPHLKEG